MLYFNNLFMHTLHISSAKYSGLVFNLPIWANAWNAPVSNRAVSEIKPEAVAPPPKNIEIKKVVFTDNSIREPRKRLPVIFCPQRQCDLYIRAFFFIAGRFFSLPRVFLHCRTFFR
jgi:hypothetical protein